MHHNMWYIVKKLCVINKYMDMKYDWIIKKYFSLKFFSWLKKESFNQNVYQTINN
jgi:hypothetical protein